MTLPFQDIRVNAAQVKHVYIATKYILSIYSNNIFKASRTYWFLCKKTYCIAEVYVTENTSCTTKIILLAKVLQSRKGKYVSLCIVPIV